MSAPIEVRAPREQTEGSRSRVLRWLKIIGERVDRDEPLLELETDKVNVELPAPAAGVLCEILKEVGCEVEPGDLLARLEPIAEMALGAPPAAAAGRTPGHESEPEAAETPKLSPAVRRLVGERGLDPALITGTGLGGRITAADVERFAPQRPAPAADAAVERIVHSAMRRRIAERTVESLLHTAPHVTTVFEADLAAVLAHRARHREEFARRGARLTLTAYFLRACVDAIRAVPEANARWTDDALEVYRRIDIGVVTALGERGLVVPVLRGVADLDLEATASGLDDLSRRAREDRLTPADVRDGTFTISNHGVSGSLVATPIVINQPQSAILGIGKLEKRVVVVDRGGEDAIAVRPRCYVSLTIDHRVLDGARANRFLTTLVDRLQGWRD
ncbi:MAG TPA: dihydrolipoamide acetyltransferase family protein [Steroidobacteraceae bacterium]|nr:dihydrolipoamide acetyltransferase family protein [Steroidobacteraceae bacterium]